MIVELEPISVLESVAIVVKILIRSQIMVTCCPFWSTDEIPSELPETKTESNVSSDTTLLVRSATQMPLAPLYEKLMEFMITKPSVRFEASYA